MARRVLTPAEADCQAMRRVHVSIDGRVQGVFFRASCAGRHAALGVAGWVRNAVTGSVEAVFEGPAAACRGHGRMVPRGPRHARVDAVDVREEPPAKTGSGPDRASPQYSPRAAEGIALPGQELHRLPGSQGGHC